MAETYDASPLLHRRILQQHPDLVIGLAIFAIVLALYMMTLAPGLVFGDPAEYTFVPYIWGISHPPGYAFQTVLGGVWQRIIPIGSIAYRANLLSAAAGATIAALVYGAVRMLARGQDTDSAIVRYVPPILAAGSAATAADVWQHSIHANAHIITALLATASLFALIRWYSTPHPPTPSPTRSLRSLRRGGEPQEKTESSEGEIVGGSNRWLYVFCVLAGVSVTHHPLLAFSFPAYAAFIIAVRPHILRDVRTLIRMIGCALIGLSVWLYLPLRASLPAPMLFGPDNTNTLNGFLDLVLARGLRVNLFHYGLADQPDRAVVFWSLLNLQASLPVIGLMAFGLIWLWRRQWRVGLLYTVFLGVNLAFILNTIQDVMAYLMVPFAALVALAGLGLIPIFERIRFPRLTDQQIVHALLGLIAVGLPLLRIADLADVISLRHYTEAEDWIGEVYATFEGQGEGAILLAHWEHLTPLWYEAWVEDRPLDRDDLRLVFVAANSATPWVDNVWANIDRGLVYVSGYQRELIEAGFRLRPVGRRLYRVLPAPATDMPDMQMMLNAQAGLLTVVGVDLPQTTALPGQVVPLSIALADSVLAAGRDHRRTLRPAPAARHPAGRVSAQIGTAESDRGRRLADLRGWSDDALP